ncbi:hypothetical protein [Microvirga splendida]|uniref:Uncharacterized protein n=1 Tax=Microvirga splendida TaxID=2795727 RepID=A0ABS0Y3W5_9HYPH|nr:hypothetical protein [Microvirga splendida]MBJ6127003.1 hypothetical protein [Microvirga splendida]
MGDTDFIRKSLFMTGGLIIWGIHFGLVYTFNALACARRFAGTEILGIGIVPLTVIGTTIVALAATLLVLLLAFWRKGPAAASRDEKPVNDFMRYTTITIAGLSLVAIAWNGLPAFLIPPCG